MVLDWLTFFSNFNSTDFNASLIEVLLTLLQRVVGLIVDLLVGTLIAKHVEFFEDFYFFGLGTISNEQYFFESKSTSASDDVAHVVSFADVVEEKIPLRFVCLHQQRIILLILIVQINH